MNFLKIVYDEPYEPYVKGYKLELIDNWRKGYSASRKLINFSISVGYLDNEKVIKENLLHTENPKLNTEINSSLIYYYNEKPKSTTPILKDTGTATFINPLEIYLSLDEYFSKEITESIEITDKEKNH